MAYVNKQIKFKFLELVPLLLLFYISLNGHSVIDLKYFSINVHYILVYYWVLRQPRMLGYGFIFMSGVISDVVFGLPLGVNALSLLIIAAVATYARVVTVRITLLSDWISFIPALLVANFIYFLSLYFSNYSVDYLFLFKNSIFTFIFYPILWSVFTLILNLTKS
ncbi:MAG: rod shape-determining protein MreD [Candidatus Pelagibacterales bacterium]|nr:MAG: rod shape-determining protein MreD [Pelagibacterales bacterium]